MLSNLGSRLKLSASLPWAALEKAASQDHHELLPKPRSGREGCCHNQTATPNIVPPVSALWLNPLEISSPEATRPRAKQRTGHLRACRSHCCCTASLGTFSSANPPAPRVPQLPSVTHVVRQCHSTASGVMGRSQALLACHYWLLPTRDTWLRAGIISQQAGLLFLLAGQSLSDSHPQMLNDAPRVLGLGRT